MSVIQGLLWGGDFDYRKRQEVKSPLACDSKRVLALGQRWCLPGQKFESGIGGKVAIREGCT